MIDPTASTGETASIWPRYRGWPVFIAYALGVAALWAGLDAVLGLSSGATQAPTDSGWLTGLFQRLPDSQFKIFLAILAAAALLYAMGQLLTVRRERSWLIGPCFVGPNDWAQTLLFARPRDLYIEVPEKGQHATRLRHHVQFGLEDALAPLSALLWAFPMLGFLGTIAGLSDAVARLPAALESDDVGSVLDGLHLAFDTTMIGLLATLLLFPITIWIDQARGPLIKARQDLDTP